MAMQQPFSHGLLYSVAPEDFPRLHLRDEDEQDGFAWETEEPSAAKAFIWIGIDFLKNLIGH